MGRSIHTAHLADSQGSIPFEDISRKYQPVSSHRKHLWGHRFPEARAALPAPLTHLNTHGLTRAEQGVSRELLGQVRLLCLQAPPALCPRTHGHVCGLAACLVSNSGAPGERARKMHSLCTPRPAAGTQGCRSRPSVTCVCFRPSSDPRVISSPRKVDQDGSNSQKCLGETLMASYQWGHVIARAFMCRVCVRMCGLHSLGSTCVHVCICVCLLVLSLGLVRQE